MDEEEREGVVAGPALPAEVPRRGRVGAPERERDDERRERDGEAGNDDTGEKAAEAPGRERGLGARRRRQGRGGEEKRDEAGGGRGAPAVRHEEDGEEERREGEEERAAERGDVELRARPLPEREEEDGEEAEEEGEGEEVGVEVGEEEAPERELVDLVLRLQDARDRPEEVEVDDPASRELEGAGEVPGEEAEAGGEGSRPEAPAEERPGGEERGGGECGGGGEAEVEGEGRVDAEGLRERRDEELPEVGVGERRPGEPRLRRRKELGTEEDVQEREVHRLLAPEDLRREGADGGEEEERTEEEALGREQLAAGERARRPGGERPGEDDDDGRGEGERRDEGEEPPRDEGPGGEAEEGDAGHFRKGVDAGDGGEARPEEPPGGEAERLEEREPEEERERRGARARDPLLRVGMRVVGAGAEDLPPGERAGRHRLEKEPLEGRGVEAPGVAEDGDARVVVDGERLVGELGREAEAEELRG